MANLYAAERQDAKEAIEEDGALGAIRRDGVDTPASFLITSYSQNEIDGDLVRRTDLKMMVADMGLSLGAINKETDTVVITDSNELYASSVGEYRIIDPGTFMPGGIAIYHEMQVRKIGNGST